MSRQLIAPLALGGMVVACAVVAAALGRPVWAAAVGSGLALLSWGLEALTWRRGADVPFNAALAVALGGMILRLAAVLGVLVVVGLLDRAAFATAALSFLAAFTVYMGLRFFTYPLPAPKPRREVRLP